MLEVRPGCGGLAAALEPEHLQKQVSTLFLPAPVGEVAEDWMERGTQGTTSCLPLSVPINLKYISSEAQ